MTLIRLITSICKGLVPMLLQYSLSSCSIYPKFNGASIDYDVTKTIQFADFPIRSAYVWMPMHAMFNNELQDTYMK